MGKIAVPRIIILAMLLVATALSVYGISGIKPREQVKAPLDRVLGELPGWNGGENFEMGPRIVDALKLDDHLFRSYRRGSEQVTLYIGFYRTAGKVGAAHDPLVCFTGQGWRLGNRSTGNARLGASGLKVNFATMIAERQGERELLVYWFQTNGTTSTNTVSQKAAMVWDRLNGRGEDNAFVRLSTPIGDEAPDAARRRIFAFIEAFYPVFHGYLVEQRVD